MGGPYGKKLYSRPGAQFFPIRTDLVLQNKAAKIILDQPLYSSASHALATLKWIPLEKRRFQRRCLQVYKCLSGLINRELTLLTQQYLVIITPETKSILDSPALKETGENKELPIMM